MDYKERLAGVLELRDWSLRKLAHMAHVSLSSLQAMMTTEGRHMRFTPMIAIALALDISMDWLAFGRTREPAVLTPDEDELLKAYRTLDTDADRSYALNSIKTLPRRK